MAVLGQIYREKSCNFFGSREVAIEDDEGEKAILASPVIS